MQGAPNRSSPSKYKRRRSPCGIRSSFMAFLLCFAGLLMNLIVWTSSGVSSGIPPNADVPDHMGFALAVLSIGVGIWLGAWPGGRRANLNVSDPRSIRRRSVGQILHASGIATVLPVAGALLRVFGGAIRSTRYARWKLNASTPQFSPPPCVSHQRPDATGAVSPAAHSWHLRFSFHAYIQHLS